MSLTIRTTGIEDYLSGGEAYVKALILGQPSSGKTRSASFWPKPIFADCEKGRMSIADRQVPYGEITSQADMREFVRRLNEECRKPVRDRAYQTVVIDTLDSYQKIIIAERLKDTKKDSMSGWEDWGHLDTKMMSFLHALTALPMNIVVNVHTKDRKEGDDGPTFLGPRLKGDARESVSELFDLIGLMQVHWEAVNGERTLTRSIEWHPRPDVPILKDRSGRLPKFTPVTFTDQDYEGLFSPLAEALDDLKPSGDLETLETDADRAPAPVAPAPGGAVDQPQAGPTKRAVSPAKKAAAPPAKAAVKAPEPAAAAPEPEPAPETPAPAEPVAEPVAEPEKPKAAARAVPPASRAVPAAKRPSMEVVEANLPKGQPVPDPSDPLMTKGPLPTAPEKEQTPTTDVPEHEVTEEEAVDLVTGELGGKVIQQIEHPAPEEAPAEAAAPEAPVAPAAQSAPTCGQAGRNPKTGKVADNPVPGCGKDLSTEDRDMVNISFIKTTREGRGTYLCPACLAAHKAAA